MVRNKHIKFLFLKFMRILQNELQRSIMAEFRRKMK
jgi:hypothetical protein